MNQHIRDRAFLPVAIPVGALIFIFLIAFPMARVLLDVPKEIATAVALMAAFNILAACTFLALRSGFSVRDYVPMAGVVFLPVVLGMGVAMGVIPVEAVDEHGAGHEATVIEISADKLTFDTDRLEVPAEEAFEMKFENKEAQPHNVVITDASGATLFKQPFFSGPKTVTWKVDPIPAGEHPFKCEVHPNMAGVVVATPSEDKGAGEGDHGESVVAIAADDLKFDKSELEVPAGSPFELELDNREAQPHNVEILTAKGGQKLFTQPFFNGPKKVSWQVPALEAGTYWFQCQVHPTMNGTVHAG